MSFFKNVPLAPPDPILGLTSAFQNDPRKEKVNLGVGLFKTEDLKTPILQCVKAAEAVLLEKETSKEYLPIAGEKLYVDGVGEIVFGKQWNQEKGRIAYFQTIGGTGALRTAGAFLKEEKNPLVMISSPTWPNHRGVFSNCGLVVKDYPYYNSKSYSVDFELMFACLEKLPTGSVVVLHGACHNPTGFDLSLEEWKTLCELFKRRGLIPFFDFAYQGLGRGLEEDAEAIRYFFSQGVEMFVAVSHAKNLSLYGERVGCLFIVADCLSTAERVFSRVKQVIRTDYSSPPMHGACIAAQIFHNPLLRKKWVEELDEMRARIVSMRHLFVEHMKGVDYSHILRGMGMFGFTGLGPLEVEKMIADYGIYMPSDGRINMCGLNSANIDYVASAILALKRGA